MPPATALLASVPNCYGVLHMGFPENDFRGWYNTRNLPHYDAPDAIQFITFRLADSVPSQVIRGWKRDVEYLPDAEQSNALRRRVERYLDAGHGCCLLAHPAMAATLRQSFEFYQGTRYQLLAWTIMPNHVHILIKPSYSLPRIVQGWKTHSARWALQNAQRLDLQLPIGGFWMRGYWDRFIRSEAHLAAAMHYIRENPVKAGLCRTAAEWRWSSAWTG